jgi:hypothetical protein
MGSVENNLRARNLETVQIDFILLLSRYVDTCEQNGVAEVMPQLL